MVISKKAKSQIPSQTDSEPKSKAFLPMQNQSQSKQRLPSWLQSLLIRCGVFSIITGSAAIAVGGGWLGILMILNPDGALWLNRYLPQWFKVPITVYHTPQNFAAIEEEAKKFGFRLGEPVAIGEELLIPMWWTDPNCKYVCERIVAIRIYEHRYSEDRQEIDYQLLREVDIPSIRDAFVSAPITKKAIPQPDNSKVLPLRQLTLMEGGAQPGTWLTLHHNVVRGGKTVTYGQLFLYEPSQSNLNFMLSWTSPAGEIPKWQEVTGDRQPELVVDQTIGLEPQFQVYQLQNQEYEPHVLRPYPENPFELEEISLQEPASALASDNPEYTQALSLSRQGLWSEAKSKLHSVRQKLTSPDWNTQTQAQLDLIRLHAQATESQCYQSWTNTSQQVLNCLINGSLSDALLIFQGSLSGSLIKEVTELVQADTEGFGKRIEATLAIKPHDEDAQIWGALILAMQQGKQQALTWWEQLPQRKLKNRQQLEKLLAQLEEASQPTTNSRSNIVGTATLPERVNLAHWLQPQQTAPLPFTGSQQVWYLVQVNAFDRGEGWQPVIVDNLSSTSGEKVWQELGLQEDTQINITLPTAQENQPQTTAKVKAIRLRNGLVELLAVGEMVPNLEVSQSQQLLAHSNDAFRWLQPGSVSFSDLHALQPNLVELIVPQLWQELRLNNQLSQPQPPELSEVLAEIGDWQVQPIDLTGDQQSELILTIEAQGVKQLNQQSWLGSLASGRKYRGGTLIFSATGVILYSEYSRNAFDSLTAIADLGDGGSAALLVNRENHYALKRWSVETEQFE